MLLRGMGLLIEGGHLDAFKENATLLINEIVTPLNAARVPFSSTQGVGSRLFLQLFFVGIQAALESRQPGQHHTRGRNCSRTRGCSS
jgi:hypothetical protein